MDRVLKERARVVRPILCTPKNGHAKLSGMMTDMGQLPDIHTCNIIERLFVRIFVKAKEFGRALLRPRTLVVGR